MADIPHMDEERHAEKARQDALWALRGQSIAPLPDDEEVLPQQFANEQFGKSGHGAIDRTLKAGTDWIKKMVQKRKAPFEAAEQQGVSHGFGPMDAPAALPSPVELIPTMMLESSEAPPILVDGDRFIDGGHRFEAYRQAGRSDIPTVDIGPFLRMSNDDWKQWIDGGDPASAPLLRRQAPFAETPTE